MNSKAELGVHAKGHLTQHTVGFPLLVSECRDDTINLLPVVLYHSHRIFEQNVSSVFLAADFEPRSLHCSPAWAIPKF